MGFNSLQLSSLLEQKLCQPWQMGAYLVWLVSPFHITLLVFDNFLTIWCDNIFQHIYFFLYICLISSFITLHRWAYWAARPENSCLLAVGSGDPLCFFVLAAPAHTWLASLPCVKALWLNNMFFLTGLYYIF